MPCLDLIQINRLVDIASHNQIKHTDRHSQLFIADAGSKLGTFINGKRISPKNKVLLKTGDVLVRDFSQALAGCGARLNEL